MTDQISDDDLAALESEIRALEGPREHICACPRCGVTLTVPCAGEVIADVKVGGVDWEHANAETARADRAGAEVKALRETLCSNCGQPWDSRRWDIETASEGSK